MTHEARPEPEAIVELEARLRRAEAELDAERQAHERLRQALAHEAPRGQAATIDFRAIFEALPGMYLAVTPDLTLVAITDSLQAATRLDRKTAVGRFLFEVLPDDPEHPTGADVWRASLRKVVETCRPDRMPLVRYSVRRADGDGFEDKFWNPANYPVCDEAGRLRYILHYTEDVTERLRLQQVEADQQRLTEALLTREAQVKALKEADALKEQFLGILSHELRTPINAITGFGSILDDGLVGELNAEQHAYLRKILAGTETLLALVDDLLDMSRIQAGKFQLSCERVCFERVAREVLGNLKPLADKKHHRLVNEVPDDLPEFQADPLRLRQIMTNLVNNAIKFTGEGGTIRVRARAQDGMLRCEVADSGVGLAAQDIPKLFKPFSQVDMTSTRKAGGTGLGLSISKALVEAHGGTIGVQSGGTGTGATFWFTLPLNESS